MARVVGPVRPELLGDAIRTIGTIVDRGVVRNASASAETARDATAPGDDEIASRYREVVEQLLSDNTPRRPR